MSDGARRTVRTVFQNVLGLAAAMPLIVDAARLSDAVPGVAVALTVSGVVTRVMALPVVDALLPGWLRSVPRG
jgi:ABC-type phosphate transport system permease subunit